MRHLPWPHQILSSTKCSLSLRLRWDIISWYLLLFSVSTQYSSKSEFVRHLCPASRVARRYLSFGGGRVTLLSLTSSIRFYQSFLCGDRKRMRAWFLGILWIFKKTVTILWDSLASLAVYKSGNRIALADDSTRIVKILTDFRSNWSYTRVTWLCTPLKTSFWGKQLFIVVCMGLISSPVFILEF